MLEQASSIIDWVVIGSSVRGSGVLDALILELPVMDMAVELIRV